MNISTNHIAPLVHLKVLAEQCTLCGLHAERKHVVFSRGDGSSGLLVVGEAPGVDEDAGGTPFVGDSGKLLDRMLRGIGLDPAKAYVCNVIKCRPPSNRVPHVNEIAACRGYLFRQIQIVKPRVIITLGQTAGRTLLGADVWPGMASIRGKWQHVMGADLMPTFHPAYLLRQQSKKAIVAQDMLAVKERLKTTSPTVVT